MGTEPSEIAGTTRRHLFAGAGAVGAGALLAACGNGSGGSDGDGDDGSDHGDSELAEVEEVEVGGGVINSAAEVVVTQPTEGDFRGFSAICTHQGCTVSEVVDRMIVCSCHGSQYSIEDGSVITAAPGLTSETQDPLPPVDVAVDGDVIVRS